MRSTPVSLVDDEVHVIPLAVLPAGDCGARGVEIDERKGAVGVGLAQAIEFGDGDRLNGG
jgi:hypothetical protein